MTGPQDWDQGTRSQYRADITGTHAGVPPWEQGHREQRDSLSSVLKAWLCIWSVRRDFIENVIFVVLGG